jgi:FkbM family methyltransferase
MKELESMHVVLLMVGAHSGEIRRDNILQAADKGFVILIEPVPFLFERLSKTYAGLPNITCLNCCVSSRAGKISFFAPTEEATKVCPWGDQLGSISADHAVHHNQELSAYIEEIQVEAFTFTQIIEKFDITSLDVLFTDTAGMVASMAFGKNRPSRDQSPLALGSKKQRRFRSAKRRLSTGLKSTQ